MTPYRIDIELGLQVHEFGGVLDPARPRGKEGNSMEGIFEIKRHPTDRSKDVLRWCFAMPGFPPPKDFEVRPGSGHSCVELQRFVVDDEKEIAESLKAIGATIGRDSDGGWVKSVSLPEKSVPRDALDSLKQLRKLTHLAIHHANSGLVDSLTNHTAITHLSVQCDLPVEVLEPLVVGLPHLRMFSLKSAKFSDEQGRALAKAESLEKIFFYGVRNELRGLKHLEGRRIGALHLKECHLDRDSFESIASLKELAALYANDCRVDKNGDVFEPVSFLENLQVFILRGTSVGETAISSFEPGASLSVLSFDAAGLEIDSIKPIVQRYLGDWSVKVSDNTIYCRRNRSNTRK